MEQYVCISHNHTKDQGYRNFLQALVVVMVKQRTQFFWSEEKQIWCSCFCQSNLNFTHQQWSLWWVCYASTMKAQSDFSFVFNFKEASWCSHAFSKYIWWMSSFLGTQTCPRRPLTGCGFLFRRVEEIHSLSLVYSLLPFIIKSLRVAVNQPVRKHRPQSLPDLFFHSTSFRLWGDG